MTGQKREKGDYSSGKKIPHTSDPHEDEQKDCSRINLQYLHLVFNGQLFLKGIEEVFTNLEI